MSKVKTRKILAKRFKVTKTGKILRGQSFTSHLRVKKSSKQRRRLGRMVKVTGPLAKKLSKVIGIKK